MKPSILRVLIHCYYLPSGSLLEDSQSVREALVYLEARDLLEKNDAGDYQTTQRGKIHVEKLCDLPLPQLIWV
jgi:hypothetical protein